MPIVAAAEADAVAAKRRFDRLLPMMSAPLSIPSHHSRIVSTTHGLVPDGEVGVTPAASLGVKFPA
jgi:hypothetical protein